MIIPPTIVDDFKTERRDITPPLQPILRLVPLFFYASLLAVVLLGTLFFAQLRLAEERLRNEERRLADLQAEVEGARTERSGLEAKILRARDIEEWAKSSRPLQPLVVTIARSIKDGSTIEDLRLDRTEDTSAKMRMNLRLASNSMAQLDTTLQSLGEKNYRLFSPQQQVNKGEIDYSATIVRQDFPGSGDGQEPPPGQEPSFR